MSEEKRPIRIAQIGHGYWGPNLARNFYQLPDAELAYVVDANPDARATAERLYGCRSAATLDDVLADERVQGISLATPARTHHALASQALAAGKHVFIEKPLAMTVAEGEALVKLAAQQECVLMVGHVFEYNPAVHYIKRAIDGGDLGEVYYLYSRRVNLGRVQSDINALWSIAPHDISIAIHLLGQQPEAVSCQGAACLNGQVQDVVFLTLHFAGEILCHIHVSWLDPSKTRELTVVGSRKMIVYDDVATEGKVRIYDKGAYRKGDPIYGEFQYKLHSGDIWIPRIDMQEPLRLECAHFVECIRDGKRPLTDGENGLRVVRVLEAGQQSLDNGGMKVALA
ncbi:MAG: Gfo/Idh/MocA family oxidoreductase [Caldilineaceae bacterium]|nr:Gfo/Idh/MocA family oxidoreductase [Caldilineaceae bacterium]